MENNIYIIGLDRNEKPAKIIVRGAAEKILDLFEHLLQEQQHRDKNRKDE